MPLPRLRPAVLAALLIFFGAILIATTWRRFSDTVDESTHVGAGLELLQYHRYTLQPENPPLPRVVFGATALAGGMRISDPEDRMIALHSVFYDHGEYRKNLIAARCGNLLFYALAAILLYLLARRELSERGAVIAVLLFVTQPIILGYSGIANHDLAGTAGFALSLLAFSSWLRMPDAKHAAILGLAFSFSVLCKFSNLGFVPAACAAIFAVRLLHDPELRRGVVRKLALVIAIVPAVTAIVIWAGYAFTVARAFDLHYFQSYLPLISRLPPLAPIPAPEFFRGIAGLIEISRGAFQSYLFGEVRDFGWWYYFPVAVALKTTLSFLALLIAGFFVARKNRAFAESLAAAGAVLAVSMTSHLDLGVRYVLPAYIPMTIAAAAATVALLEHKRVALRYAAIVAISLQMISLGLAAPDYFPYFNALAGDDPGRYLVDSNLDWGQDVLRLRSEVRRLRIDRIGLYVGWYDAHALGFPKSYNLTLAKPADGWLAISEHAYRTDGNGRAWSWLDWYAMRRIGKSIRLYYVPPC